MPAERELMEPILVRYKGFYDYHGLYQMLRDWCKKHHMKLYENVFKEKPATHGGMETELKWHANRRETPFVKYHIDFKVTITDNQPVEVVHNGEKKSLYKGRIEFRADSWLEYDWTQQYKGWASKFFLWLIWKKIMFWEWKIKHEDTLNDLLSVLSEDVKKFLNMYQHSGFWYG